MKEEVQILAILQARTSSTRLPGKVLMEINGMPVIGRQIHRIMRSRKISKLVLATSTDISDDALVDFVSNLGLTVFRGSLNNVFSRFEEIIRKQDFEVIVRLTGDCPLVMPEIIDQAIEAYLNQNVDYLSNALLPTYPDGLDVEVFSKNAFLKLAKYELNSLELEHVTLGFINRYSDFSLHNLTSKENLAELRWTLDYVEDLTYIRKVYSYFEGKEEIFNFEDILNLLAVHPELINQKSGKFRNIASRTLKGDS